MTLWTIGRTALDGPGFGLEPGPILLSRSGDRVRMSGTYFPASLSEGIAFAQQMSGYGSEPVVPLIGPSQFGVTGFYRPAGFAVTAVPNLTNVQGIWEWTANLERMPNGYGQVKVEHDWLITDLGVLFGAVAETNTPAVVSAPIDYLAAYRSDDDVPFTVGSARWSPQPSLGWSRAARLVSRVRPRHAKFRANRPCGRSPGAGSARSRAGCHRPRSSEVSKAPPPEVVITLLPLKDKMPTSPKLPTGTLFTLAPRASAASSIRGISYLSDNCLSASTLAGLP